MALKCKTGNAYEALILVSLFILSTDSIDNSLSSIIILVDDLKIKWIKIKKDDLLMTTFHLHNKK